MKFARDCRSSESNEATAQLLFEALPWINNLTGKTVVIKYGGAAMVDEQLRRDVMSDIVLLKIIGMRPVIVHGGGKAINEARSHYVIPVEFKNGQRVTTPATMDIVREVLGGKVNQELVAAINHHGNLAVGVSGSDAGTLLAAPLNRHEKWRIDDPDRFRYEVATMGCRTRGFENLHGEKSSWGRGNLSFTSMNLPRLAIEAMREAGDMIPDGNKHAIRKEAREIFLESVRKTATMMAEQLYERYCFQRTALARQFPFMMSNDVWKGGGRLQPNDEVGDVLKHGTLGIGVIGGHNAMVAIYGEGHATSKEAWQTLYDAVTVMNRVVEEYKAK